MYIHAWMSLSMFLQCDFPEIIPIKSRDNDVIYKFQRNVEGKWVHAR